MALLHTPSTAFTQTTLETLESNVQGSVFLPGDAGYDDARQAWNLTVDQHPQVIVVAKKAADIVEAVRFAQAEDLGIAIQATGHGVALPADDSLLIVTSQMKEVRVDAEAQTAWIEAGAKWGIVLEKAQAVGLAPLLGSTPDVGAIGYTLGGGMGWLGRKYGLAIDSVIAFEMVTADGRLLRASEVENSDLFWGLRGGGGGSFGVVTAMEIKLYPVATIFGGNLFYPVELAKEVYTRYRDWIASAPEALTSSIVIMNFPSFPAVPEPLRGKSFVMVRGAYTGPVEEGQALIQTWLDWKTPAMNMFRVMPFSEVATISSDPVDPSASSTTSVWMRELSDEAIDVLIERGVSRSGSSPLVVTEIRHAGGAMARGNGGAYSNRDASLVLELIAITPTPEAQRFARQYMQTFTSELQPYLTGRVYINFLEGEEKHKRTKNAFSPESYGRLMALKAKFDPENRFRYGFHIPVAREV